jgi:SAM-dependent methyltransferase
MQQVFTNIYEYKVWGDNRVDGYSGSSGPGSSVVFNIQYINFVRDFIRRHSVRSVVDVGCGDFKCANLIYDDMPDVDYHGLDVYAKLIDHLRFAHARPNRTFSVFDASQTPENIPSADLCVVKDVLQHWPNSAIKRFMDVAITKFRYILVTNDQNGDLGNDTVPGGYHRITSMAPPLSDYGALCQLLYPSRETSLIETKIQ